MNVNILCLYVIEFVLCMWPLFIYLFLFVYVCIYKNCQPNENVDFSCWIHRTLFIIFLGGEIIGLNVTKKKMFPKLLTPTFFHHSNK